ncbi:hypothetical protein ACHAXH_006807 [Discostella pseudostelligera]
MSSGIIDISDADDLDLPNNPNNSKSILFFWADWHAPSNTGGPFDTVVKALAAQNDGSVIFYRVLAEEAPMLSGKYHVTTVPTFIFISADGAIMDRVDGGEDVAIVTQYYSKLVNAVTQTTTSSSSSSHSTQQPPREEEEPPPQQSLNDRLQSILTSSPIMLFLKGTPTAPRCGFSRQAVELLTSSNVSFAYFDILQDEEVRQGLKVYSDWPTYPQFYVRGELVGGLDIMKELMEEEGGLVQQLDLGEFVIRKNIDSSITVPQKEDEAKNEGKEASINERLKQLVNRHRIMLFMKGIPSSPKCGFSRQIVEILNSFHVSYDAFNILEDNEVREGLKVYSDWPTYPQLYVEGDLVGGLDIVNEMVESGDLEDLLRGSVRD